MAVASRSSISNNKLRCLSHHSGHNTNQPTKANVYSNVTKM